GIGIEVTRRRRAARREHRGDGGGSEETGGERGELQETTAHLVSVPCGAPIIDVSRFHTDHRQRYGRRVTEWKPKPKVDANTEDMNLTGEEGSVLARVDGFTSMQNISLQTGLPEGRVRQIVS